MSKKQDKKAARERKRLMSMRRTTVKVHFGPDPLWVYTWDETSLYPGDSLDLCFDNARLEHDTEGSFLRVPISTVWGSGR